MSDSETLSSHESDSPHHAAAKAAKRPKRAKANRPSASWARSLYWPSRDGHPSVYTRFLEARTAGGDPCLLARPHTPGRPGKEFCVFPSRMAAAQFVAGLPPQRRYYFEKVGFAALEG